jgi:hypothetical protein
MFICLIIEIKGFKVYDMFNLDKENNTEIYDIIIVSTGTRAYVAKNTSSTLNI